MAAIKKQEASLWNRAHELDANNDTWTIGHVYGDLEALRENGSYGALKSQADQLSDALPPAVVNKLAIQAFQMCGPIKD